MISGLGMGWRPELARLAETRADLSFLEIIAENWWNLKRLPDALVHARERGTAIIPHGISLSLGGAEKPDPSRLSKLARLAERTGAPLVSEHIAFVRAGGREAGHLLPVPRTRAMLDVLVDNVRAAQQVLPVPLALENIASFVEWPDAELTEAELLGELLERTNAMLLLDLSNLYANARNADGHPAASFNELPLHRLAYAHVGGGEERDGLYHDTHSHPVPKGVFVLAEQLVAQVPNAALMLERDDFFDGTIESISAEMDTLSAILKQRAGHRV